MKWIRKAAALLAAALILFPALGCGSGEKIIGGDINNAGDDGYSLIYNNVEIKPGGKMAPVISALGDPTNYFEAASCAFAGLDKTYIYGSVQVNTYPDGKNDRILSVVLLDDACITPEGVTVGSEVSEVIAAYGENYTESGTAMIYNRGGTQLKFLVRDGCVTSVQYYDTTAGN